MKNVSWVLLAVVTLAFAALADAAPKKRTRNANRTGPYVVGFVGQSTYPNDQSFWEQYASDSITESGYPVQGLTVGTEDTDIGYNATFGYRFNRYLAAELALAHYGSVESTASAGMDFGDGFGYVPVSLNFEYSAGGPVISAVGILPLNEKFELFGRLGFVLTSAERELSARIDGEDGGSVSAKDDSTDLVIGLGGSYNFNYRYSLRLEYQQVDEMGQADTTGLEDVRVIGLALAVRF